MGQELNWETLYDADITLKVPFHLILADSNRALVCEKIIRFVPQKRLVAFAKWGNEEVIAKLFFNRKEAKDASFRDARGVKALQNANIPTPKLLYEGIALNQQHLHVILLEKINNAFTLADCFRAKSSIEEITPLMRAVTIEIATHHVLGILQHDLHFKNFLITESLIYSLDGSKIKKYDKPLSHKLSIKYFALFLMQLGVGTEELREELFRIYAKSRGWILNKSDHKLLQANLQYLRQDYGRRYLKKIFRDCTLFKKISNSKQSIMYDRDYKSDAFMEFLHNPEKVFSDINTEILKAGRSCTVAKITIGEHTLVVKRYNIKNSWHWLRRFFRKTRAAKSWRLSQRLQLSGVLTAKPVAFIDTHYLGLRGKSYFVMEYVTGKNVGDYFSDAKLDDPIKKNVAKNIIRLFKNLKELNLIHGDLKMTNILISNDKPLLIDLDGMIEYRSKRVMNKAFENEIQRFMINWQDSPTIFTLFYYLIKEEKLV